MSVASPVRNLRHSIVWQLGDILPPRQGVAAPRFRPAQARTVESARSSHRTAAGALRGQLCGLLREGPPSPGRKGVTQASSPLPMAWSPAWDGGHCADTFPSSLECWQLGDMFKPSLRKNAWPHTLGTVTSLG